MSDDPHPIRHEDASPYIVGTISKREKFMGYKLDPMTKNIVAKWDTLYAVSFEFDRFQDAFDFLERCKTTQVMFTPREQR